MIRMNQWMVWTSSVVITWLPTNNNSVMIRMDQWNHWTILISGTTEPYSFLSVCSSFFSTPLSCTYQKMRQLNKSNPSSTLIRNMQQLYTPSHSSMLFHFQTCCALPGILKKSRSPAPLLVCRNLLSWDQSRWVMKLELPVQVPTRL